MANQAYWGVVAARMRSSRMPGKSMALLSGTPSLAHIIRRLRKSRFLEGVVIATTDHPSDDAIRDCARAEGAAIFSGSEEDVLGRTLKAAQSVKAGVIVQVTGDCPLIDAEVVDHTIAEYIKHQPDYACNRMPETYPNGMDTELFSTALLDQVSAMTDDPADREHVSLYIYERPQRFRLLNVPAPDKHHWPQLRLTLDTEEDYEMISAIYGALYPENPLFGLTRIIAWLRENPQVLAMNAHVQQKPVRA